MKISSILLMAGSSNRFNLNKNKNLYEINNKHLFLYSLDTFYNHQKINNIYLVVKEEEYEDVLDIVKQNYDDRVSIIVGGDTRSKSVKNALCNITDDGVLIHDCARPLVTSNDIDNIIDSLNHSKCATMYHKVFDTIKEVTDSINTINRDNLKAVTTPQAFTKQLYEIILNNDNELITDEIALFEKDYTVAFIEETRNNLKVTTTDDLAYVEYILMNKSYKVGHSFDFHTFTTEQPLVLGGVKFDTNFGLLGHSDADVVYHVVTEAILGALQLGDIGTHFPDTDMKYHKMDSSYFVKEAVRLLNEAKYTIENIDVIIYLEEPNLKNHKYQMAQNIKKLTGASYVNVKATTLEKKGLVGRKEGIASEAVVLIKK